MTRVGLLSDIHCELTPAGSRWINAFEPLELDRRLDEALGWFAEEHVDAVVILGDLVQIGNVEDLEHAFDRLVATASAPLATVNGNHDLRIPVEFTAAARAREITLLPEEPLALGAVTVGGVELGRAGPGLPFYEGSYTAPSERPHLVASHFPLLSEAERVAGAGIPYAGDLVNRRDVLELVSSEEPVVVVSGHIHARCSTSSGPVLQFTVGALIEPPFDCTIVDLDERGPVARRRSRRLGPVAPVDPVFADDDETWLWNGGTWERQP